MTEQRQKTARVGRLPLQWELKQANNFFPYFWRALQIYPAKQITRREHFSILTPVLCQHSAFSPGNKYLFPCLGHLRDALSPLQRRWKAAESSSTLQVAAAGSHREDVSPSQIKKNPRIKRSRGLHHPVI